MNSWYFINWLSYTDDQLKIANPGLQNNDGRILQTVSAEMLPEHTDA